MADTLDPVAYFNPLLYYKCNEPSGNLHDYGSAGKDAVVFNESYILYNQADNRGTNEAVAKTGNIYANYGVFITPYEDALTNLTAFEWHFLVKLDGSNMTGVDRRLFGTSKGAHAFVMNDNIIWKLRTDEGIDYEYEAEFPVDEWVTASLVFDGADAKIYLNGTEVTYIQHPTFAGALQQSILGYTFLANSKQKAGFRGSVSKIMLTGLTTDCDKKLLSALWNTLIPA